MTDTITAGKILVLQGTDLPRPLLLQTEADSNGWNAINGARSTFEKAIHAEKWTFFFMAGQINATAFGFDRQKALRSALKRLIVEVKSQHCNSIEITRVTSKSFLKVPYMSVCAHARHIQKGMLFSSSRGGLRPGTPFTESNSIGG